MTRNSGWHWCFKKWWTTFACKERYTGKFRMSGLHRLDWMHSPITVIHDVAVHIRCTSGVKESRTGIMQCSITFKMKKTTKKRNREHIHLSNDSLRIVATCFGSVGFPITGRGRVVTGSAWQHPNMISQVFSQPLAALLTFFIYAYLTTGT